MTGSGSPAITIRRRRRTSAAGPHPRSSIGGIAFRHLPSECAGEAEIAGHLHPKASVRARGRRVSRPCFVADRRRVLLPAFGCYTGGLNVLRPPVASLFPEAYHAYLLGENRVHMIARHQIERAAR